MPDEAVVESVLAAMADPTRRHILDILARRDGISATVVADQLPVSRQAVVKHLGILDQAGLVSARRFGREVRYSVRTRALALAGDWLTQRAAEWQSPSAASAAPETASSNAVAPAEDVELAPARTGGTGLTIVPDLGDDARARRRSDAGRPEPTSIPADLVAALELGTRLAGHLADRAYSLIPRPVAALLPSFLRR